MNHRYMYLLVALLTVALESGSAWAASRKMSPEQRACGRARTLLGRFLELDLRGSRLGTDTEIDALLWGPHPIADRPLLVTREYEIVRCEAQLEERTVRVRVRYQLQGVIRRLAEGIPVSSYVRGKGSADQVFRLIPGKNGYVIANFRDVPAHVSPSVALGELKKEVSHAQGSEEKSSLEEAIAELEKL